MTLVFDNHFHFHLRWLREQKIYDENASHDFLLACDDKTMQDQKDQQLGKI